MGLQNNKKMPPLGDPNTPTLLELNEKESGAITSIDTEDKQRLHRLTTLGFLPGVVLRVLQKKPSFIIQLEESEMALDLEMASVIRVQRKEV